MRVYFIFIASVLQLTQASYIKEYRGCYIDSALNRALNKAYTHSDIATIDWCVNHCAERGYRYAGLQYYYECRCGDAGYDKYGAGFGCNSYCIGNRYETCGGPLHNSVYEIVHPTTTSTTTTITTTTTTTPTTTFAKTSPTSVVTMTTTATNETKERKQFPNAGQNENKVTLYVGVGVGVFIVIAAVAVALVILLRRRKLQASKNYKNSLAKMESQTEERTPDVFHVPHTKVNGDYYACVVKTPSEVKDNRVTVADDGNDLYMNCVYNPSTATSGNTDLSGESVYQNELVYSLAEPVEDDLVVVDNELYGS